MTPQQRTRENLTARGYLVGTVEQRKQFPDKKKGHCKACGQVAMFSISVDLWNIFDIVALLPLRADPVPNPVLFVQTTSRNNHSTRRNKILASMEAKLVLLSGARILLQSWRQSEPRARWQYFDEWITLEQFKQAPNYPNTVQELVEIKSKMKQPLLPKGSTLPLAVNDFDNLPF